MGWETTKADHIGSREEQQDRVEVFGSKGRDCCLLVVADGLGGHEGGAMAAQAVVDAARGLWQSAILPLADPDGFLRELCRAAHGRINDRHAEPGSEARSTCVLFYAGPGRAHWLSVGDSRLYRFRDGTLIERTRDHSVVQMLVDMGKITEAEMADHPDQNRLLQSLGGDDDPDPVVGVADVDAQDSFLLCSDGFWETVEPQEMADGLRAPSLASATRDLVTRAVRRGGPTGDNVAVAVARQRAAAGMSRWVVLGLLVLAAASVAAVGSFWLFPAQDAPTSQPADSRGRSDPSAVESDGKTVDDSGRESDRSAEE